MIVHLWSSTIVLLLALAAARLIPMTARTRSMILTLGLAKFALPAVTIRMAAHAAAAMPLRILSGPPLAQTSTSPSHWLETVWIAVSLLLAARWLFIRHRVTRAILGHAAEASPRERAATDHHIIRSTACDSPAVVGILRPVIALPARGCDELDDDELASLLAHEEAHLLRRDNLRGFLESLLVAAFWFHPLVWFAQRALGRAREEACDEFVAASQPVEAYAAALARMCRGTLAPRVAGISCMAGGFMKERIENLMRYHDTIRSSVSHRLAVAVGAVVIIAVTLGAGISFADQGGRPYTLKYTMTPDFVFDIHVVNNATGSVVTNAKVQVPAGTSATVNGDAENRKFRIEARVDQDGSAALFLHVTENGDVVQDTIYVATAKQPVATAKQPEFTGEPISVSLKDADIRDVLKTFAQITGLKLDVDPSVTGKITVEFHDMPWDKALSDIAKQNGLTVTVHEGTIHIVRK
jgi:beta-lactamase regulating signal transducer with metallopeptidase domain